MNAPSANSTTAKRRGRPSDPLALRFKTVGLRPDQWEWLALWLPDGNPSEQMRELFERAQSFWPSGPVGRPRGKGGRFA